MPVNTLHASYESGVAKTKRVRDFERGEDAVKTAGETYLPKLSNQSKDEYESYKNRGSVVPAVSPTARAISGAIMRKEPMVTGAQDNLLQNIDGNQQSLDMFINCVISELLMAGGAGYLVEYDDATRSNVVKQYTRENIVNQAKDFIVLRQFYEVADAKDRFKVSQAEEYLELTLDENGNYIQNLWRKGKDNWEIIDTAMPTASGAPLNYIPFVFSRTGTDYWNSDPILLNLSNVNLDQYRMSADLRHGLHWTALPTLFVYGELLDANGLPINIKVGAGAANNITDTEARAELVEFTGAGLGALDTAIKGTIDTMASIGAKMLTSNAGGVKAAETARIDASSETATLSGIADVVDMLMDDLLLIMSEWGGSRASDFKINRDFIDVKLDPTQLMALLKTWQSGGMSLDTFLHQLEKGELLPSGITAKDEAGRIETTGGDFDLDIDDGVDETMSA